MKFGIVIFPGSNCDRDMQYALETEMQCEVRMLWHKESSLADISTQDCIVLPGGFSYGDYLRCGALARFSPVMESVIHHARQGGKVLGVCNGFQILCESGLLPGALLQNENQHFICKNVYITSQSEIAPISKNINKKSLKIPIAHGEGRYYADTQTMKQLEENNQIIFKYCDETGNVGAHNPNGSIHHIAGICNQQHNVFGMMPHPERACSKHLGNIDGKSIFESLINN